MSILEFSNQILKVLESSHSVGTSLLVEISLTAERHSVFALAGKGRRVNTLLRMRRMKPDVNEFP